MELLRALAVLVERPGPAHASIARKAGLPAPASTAEHTDLIRLQLPPYASIYLGRDGMLGGDARDRVAGFWRALGATPPPEPDHLASLLGGYASLCDHDRHDDGSRPTEPATSRHARHTFFWEHLASWALPYLVRVEELGAPFHARWASLLRETLAQEARRLGPPRSLPAALAAAPAPAPPEPAGPEALLAPLLAPVAGGVILTRRDLAGAARRLGLGLRQGERRFILRSLLEQAPGEVLAWLAEEARRQAERLAEASSHEAALAPALDHWLDRARGTARALDRATGATPLPVQESVHA